MKHLFLALAIVALALPGTASGKGASAATMRGPSGTITFTSGDERNGPTQLSQLADRSGLYPALFREEQLPDPLLASRPKGDLGPKYTITWTMPTSSTDAVKILQDVYPYAKPGPVTYMAPGQKVFDSKTHGGWFRAGPELKDTLVSAGLPATFSEGDSDGSFPTGIVGLLAASLVLAATTTVLLRRRTRPATVS